MKKIIRSLPSFVGTTLALFVPSCTEWTLGNSVHVLANVATIEVHIRQNVETTEIQVLLNVATGALRI